jgi:hypothetical protein
VPLFGARTEVKLGIEALTVTAGEEIVCRVDVGEIDPKVEGGRVELGYENTYRGYYRDSDGDEVKATLCTWVDVQTVPLFAGAPTRGPRVVRLRIPEDAPPTVKSAVEWQVVAIVDRRRARDSRAKGHLVVNPAPGAPAHRVPVPETLPDDMLADISMTIVLATPELRRGGTLTGTVIARLTEELPEEELPEEVNARGLRVQLVRERQEQDGIEDHKVEAKVPIMGEFTLRPGQPISVPFQIALAADAEPCFEARYNSQHWYLEAIVDIPRWPDEVSRVELLVT